MNKLTWLSLMKKKKKRLNVFLMLTGYNGLKLNLTTTYKNKIARALEKNEVTFSANEV